MIATQSTTAAESVSHALGRLHAAEAYAGHMPGGSTDDANHAIDQALATLIETPARNRPEVVGKLDIVWRWFSDHDPSVGDVLGEIAGDMAAGRPVAARLGGLARTLGGDVYADLVRSAATDAAALEGA